MPNIPQIWNSVKNQYEGVDAVALSNTDGTNRITAGQIDNLAKITSETIPSGWTRLSELDYTYQSTNPNKIKFLNNSVALINGYKGVISAGTVITLNEPPQNVPREDLMFYEMYLDVNGNPIFNTRIVDNINFTTYPEGVNDPVVKARGGSVTDTSYTYTKSTTDVGLYIAGDGSATAKTNLKSLDGYSYGICVFRIYRRPSCGYAGSDEYLKFSPLINPSNTQKVLDNDRVKHEGDGVKVTVEGKVLNNILGEAGNCESLSGWIATSMILDNVIKLYGSGSAKTNGGNYPSIIKDMTLDMTRKYFVSAYAFISAYTSGTVQLMAFDKEASTNRTDVSFDTTKLNQWQRKSIIVTGKANGGMRLYVGSYSVALVGTVNYDGIMLYDLTAIYGAGNEPTDIAKLERELPFVSGMQASKMVAIKAKSTADTTKVSEIIMPSGFIDSLKELPNGVRDTIDLQRNKAIKRVGSVVLNGSESIGLNTSMTNVIQFYIAVSGAKLSGVAIADKFAYDSGSPDYEHIRCSSGGANTILIGILKSKLTTQDVAGFKAWLQANPVTVFYELATQIEYDISDYLKGRLYVNPENTTIEVNQVSTAKVVPTGVPNAVTNGDFSNGTTGWSGMYGSVASVNGQLEFTSTAIDNAARIETSSNFTMIPTNKCYTRYVITSSKATKTSACINSVRATTVNVAVNSPTIVSSILTAPATTTPLRIYVDDASLSLAVGDKVYIDNVFALDLTSLFGAGNEPTKEWCDKYLEFGTNYKAVASTGSTALGLQRDNKDVFSGVQGQVAVIPASKYKEGTYELFYREPSETHVSPRVVVNAGTLTLDIKDGASVGSMLLTTSEVGYKKNTDGSINYERIYPTDNVLVGGQSITTHIMQNTDISKFKESDKVVLDGAWFGIVTNINGNNLTVQWNTTWSAGIRVHQNDYFTVLPKRYDNLYSDITDKEDITTLAHAVSLTGWDYNKLLVQEFDRFARGENTNY